MRTPILALVWLTGLFSAATADISTVGTPPPFMPPSAVPECILTNRTIALSDILPGQEAISSPLTGTVRFPRGGGVLGLPLPPGADKSFLTHEGGKTTVPLDWELRYQGPAGWTAWTPGVVGSLPGVGPALIWPVIVGRPVPCPFEVRCRTKAAPLQLAGRYQATGPLQFIPSCR